LLPLRNRAQELVRELDALGWGKLELVGDRENLVN
jgi:hypothetical protein